MLNLNNHLVDWSKKEHGLFIRPSFNGDEYSINLINNYEVLYIGIDNIDLALKQAFKLIK